jgi:hypothetical protein
VEPEYPITGLKNIVIFKDSDICFKDNSNCSFNFDSGRHFKVIAYFEQVMDAFIAIDETDQQQILDYDFNGIWKAADDPKDGAFRAGSDIIFGQYDFEGRIPDDLVMISERKDENLMTRCGVNIYTLKNNKWSLVGMLKAPDVLGKCEIDFRVNKVTIPRHLRGFNHQLTYQNGRFEDTSNI